MHIDHIALWTNNLERMKSFYLTYFECTSNEKYVNEAKKYASYFITFQSGTRIELMTRTDINEKTYHQMLGYAHIAINMGSEEKVNELTKKMQASGIDVESQPRTTGDGYYESVIRDPDGNRIELTAK